MMANVDVWVSNQITLRFNWSQSSQSIANNNSVVSWNLQLIASGGSISSSASKSWSVNVNGSNYSGTNTVGISSGQTKTLASGSTTIGHNADGTKSFSFSFSQQFDINYSGVGWIGTKSGSGSGTLSTIPRTSSVSSTNANIGENISITINRASSSFTHTLTYAFGGLSGTIATKTSSTSVSWTLPTSFYAQIPNSKSSWGRVICDTYSGSTKIGSSECRFDVYVKESSNKPGISATVKDINNTTKALTGDENKLIKYYSTAQFSITSTPKNSSTTKSINITYNGSNLTGGSGNTWTGQFSNVLTGSFPCSVTDTRGFTTSTTVSKTLINYVKITCALSVSNPTASGNCTLTITGNYFNGSFGSASNTLTVQYKKDNGSWTNATATKNGNTYTATVSLTGLDYTKAFTFQARATDKLATATTASKTVKSTPIFDWGASDFHFHVPVTVNGDITVNGNSKAIKMGTGPNDVYVHNTQSGKYLQLKDDGTLRYGDKLIYHEGNSDGPAQGKWFSGGFPRVATDGVMEIGRFVDFHDTNTTTSDFSTRLSANGDNKNTVYLPTGNGTLCLSNQVLGNSGSQTLNVVGGKFSIIGNNNRGHIDVQGAFHTRGDSEDLWFERHLMPASWQNTNLYIGYSDKRWKMVYATNGTIQTSDKRHKAIIDNANNEDCFNMVKNTDVFSYVMLNKSKNEMTEFERVEETLMNSGNEENIQMGIMAQDILNYDCSKYILIHSELTDEETGEQKDYYGINDYAFTSSIMAALKQEITYREELEEKVKTLEERLAKIESLLNK